MAIHPDAVPVGAATIVDIVADEPRGDVPPAASVAPTRRRRRRASRVVATREAWTGLILVATSEEG